MECFEMEKNKDLQVHKSSSNQFRKKSCNLIALEQVYKFLQIWHNTETNKLEILNCFSMDELKKCTLVSNWSL